MENLQINNIQILSVATMAKLDIIHIRHSSNELNKTLHKTVVLQLLFYL